jgi:DNA adenine methylase
VADPFLKWPGGKRWLARQIDGLVPSAYERYLEPFLGGGAVFFHLSPRRAVLSDSNGELINVYRCLKNHAEEIDNQLTSLQGRHSEALYYRTRTTDPADAVGRAVRFLYLNRTCFNGIYRVNLKGDFNVPIGSKALVGYPEGYLKGIAALLRRASIKESDFEKTLDTAATGDFVYVDPPYTVMHNSNNFVKYNAKLFSWEDQIRLAAAIKRAAGRGAAIMLSNADHRKVRELYEGFGHHRSVDRASVLAAGPQHRRRTTELIVTSYPLEPKGSVRSAPSFSIARLVG